jgi:hypothetical protein
VAVCTYNTLYAWQPQSGRLITVTEELDTPGNGTTGRGVTWSDDGRLLAGRGTKLAVWDSRQPNSPAQVYYETPAVNQAVTFAFWLPTEQALVSGWFPPRAQELELKVWQADAEGLQTIPLEGDFAEHDPVRVVYVPPSQDDDARLLLWSSQGLLALYSSGGELLAEAPNEGEETNGVALSPDGERLVTYGDNGSAAVWEVSDLSLITRYDATANFAAPSLDSAIWADDETLALADETGLVHMVHEVGADEGAITQFAGYGPGEHLVEARRLDGGRLLTAGYAEEGGSSSLRIWQAEPQTPKEGEGLPSASEGLCVRLHRSVPLPQGLGRPTAVDWGEGDVLIVSDDLGQVARWQLGGEAAILPADDLRYELAFATDYGRVLRYSGGTDGEIWRLGAEGWSLERTVEGEFEAARWTPHGLLIGLSEGAFLYDPEDGGRRPLPDGVDVRNSTMPAEDRLVLMREEAVEVWAPGGEEPLAGWEIPPGRSLFLADVSADGRLYVLRDNLLGQTYVLRLENGGAAAGAEGNGAEGAAAGGDALVEMWRTERAHANAGPALLHPSEALLATVDDGVISLVNWQSGEVVWQSTGAVAVTDHQFSTVQWITGGQYLITQAQLPRESSIFLNIGLWRWDSAQQQLILLQQTPSSGLLGVNAQAQAVLAGKPGQEWAVDPLFYPLLLDARQLQRDVQESCLLERKLSDEQRQAFSVTGR